MSNINIRQSAVSGTAAVTLTSVEADNGILVGVVLAGTPGSMLPVTNFEDVFVPATPAYGAPVSPSELLNPYLQLFWCADAHGGTTVITVPTDQTVMAAYACELVQGFLTFVKGTGSAGLGNANPFVTPLLPALPGDLFVALAYCNGTGLMIPSGTGFTAVQSTTYPMTAMSQQNNIPSAISYKASFTAENIDNYAIVMAQLR